MIFCFISFFIPNAIKVGVLKLMKQNNFLNIKLTGMVEGFENNQTENPIVNRNFGANDNERNHKIDD